jgi:hypothetical protein
MIRLQLSSLSHTWIIDIDGTILKHNGYREGGDILLEGVRDFWGRIPQNDIVILISARELEYARSTIDFLRENGIRFDHVIFGAPKGERILLNDIKPNGLTTAYAVNLERNCGLNGLSFTCST